MGAANLCYRYAWGLKHALRAMQRNGGTAADGGGGAVVNIASGCSSFIAQPAFVPYSTTKGDSRRKRRGDAVGPLLQPAV
jgi:NAD(P)-dependent dehydrogenase (short-subunit alcohol dehydrogenase family)